MEHIYAGYVIHDIEHGGSYKITAWITIFNLWESIKKPITTVMS
jgi:hypothetical protein